MIRFLIFFAGMVTIAFGMAPYDCASFLLSEYLNKDAFMLRVLLNTMAAAMAILLKGPINVGTILLAFFTGPLVGVFCKKVNQKLKNTVNI